MSGFLASLLAPRTSAQEKAEADLKRTDTLVVEYVVLGKKEDGVLDFLYRYREPVVFPWGKGSLGPEGQKDLDGSIRSYALKSWKDWFGSIPEGLLKDVDMLWMKAIDRADLVACEIVEKKP